MYLVKIVQIESVNIPANTNNNKQFHSNQPGSRTHCQQTDLCILFGLVDIFAPSKPHARKINNSLFIECRVETKVIEFICCCHWEFSKAHILKRKQPDEKRTRQERIQRMEQQQQKYKQKLLRFACIKVQNL